MDSFFNLRDVEFRDYLLRYSSAYCRPIYNILPLLNKKDVSDKDLVEFYLKLSNICDRLPSANKEFARMLFNYKVTKISDDRFIRFGEIIKEKTNISTALDYYLYSRLRSIVVNEKVFNKLVDIFLDEI